MSILENIFSHLDDTIKQEKLSQLRNPKTISQEKRISREHIPKWDILIQNAARDKTNYHDRYEKQKKNYQKHVHENKRMIDKDTMNTMLDAEVVKTCTRHNWPKLDICFRWTILQSYIDQKGLVLDDNDIVFLKKALQNKEMMQHVAYDKNTQCIVSMNIELPSGIKI